jgi:conjugal transfer pilin signal peptidase TrbI
MLLFVAPVGAVLLAMMGGLRINVSASIPVGAYLESRLPAMIEPGILVLVRQPGQTLRSVKPVAAVEGDVICRLGNRIWIRGIDFGPVYDIWRGQPLPSAIDDGCCIVVPPDYTFLASAAPRSYDSRYYGLIPVARLEGLVQPILTW